MKRKLLFIGLTFLMILWVSIAAHYIDPTGFTDAVFFELSTVFWFGISLIVVLLAAKNSKKQ